MTLDPHRFLGLAFASADLLFEINSDGQIVFALGAAGARIGASDSELVGRAATSLFHPDDAFLVEALAVGLEPGARGGPIAVRLAGGQSAGAMPAGATLSMCRLPQLAPNLSCSLSFKPVGLAQPLTGRPADGLADACELEAMAAPAIEIARASGRTLDLTLIELEGLEVAAGRLSPDDAAVLQRAAAGAVRAESLGGAAAARLGPDRFAVLREAGESPERVALRLARVLSVAAAGLVPNVRSQSIDSSDAQSLKAIRHATEVFLAEAASPRTEAGGGQSSLGASVQATLAQAQSFGLLVAEKRFKLVFQPVVKLSTGAVSHYESLVRFEDKRSPFALIRLAEELDMIEQLDLAVAEQVVRRLQADATRKLRVAVNISGRTIVSGRFIDAVMGMAGPDLKGRLLFEVTESAAIEDFEAAASHVSALRQRGFQVALDDFGAGAASFDYLRRLSVDMVKIDGRYIKDLAAGGRSAAVVRHVVDLCRELDVKTVAEMVETASVAAVLKQAGVEFGQGWLFGEPAEMPAPSAPVRARRTGTTDDWR